MLTRLSFWRPLLLVAGVVSLIAAVALFSVSISRPYIGVSVRFQEPGVWVVSDTAYGGLAQEAGIANGDVVLTVNGESIEEVVTHHGRLPAGGIRELEVIDSAGTKITVSVAGAAPLREGLYVPISRLILGMAFWVTGIIIYAKRPDYKAALPVYLLSLMVLVGLMAGPAATRWSTGAQTLEVITYVLIAGLFVHFFLVFPHEKRFVARHPRILYFCYVPGILPLSLLFLFGQNWLLFEPYVRAPLLGYLAVGALVGADILVHSYLRPTSPRERQQIKLFLVGVVAGIVPFVALSALPAAVTGQPLVAPQFSILCAIVIPIALAYTILKYRLIDIDFYINRALVYGVLVVLFSCGFVLIALALSVATSTLDQMMRIAILVAFSALVIIFFQPTKSKVQVQVDRWLFKERLAYRQGLMSIGDRLPSFKEAGSLNRFLVEAVAETMQISGCCLLLREVSKGLVIRAVTGELCDPTIEARVVDEARYLLEKAEPIVAAPDGFEVAFLIRLSVHDRELGALLLGHKVGGFSFTVDDLRFLSSFAGQAALAIENALLLSALNAQREELEQSKLNLESAYLGLAQALAAAVEARDLNMRGHGERVALLTRRIAIALGLPAEQVRLLEIAGRLHDIGKVEVPEGTLLKPSALQAGYSGSPGSKSVAILRFLPFLQSVLPYIERHHEWYHRGMQHRSVEESLPLGARILAVADAYDNMTSAGPSDALLSHEQALDLLQKGAGLAWDPEAVDALVRVFSHDPGG